MTDDGLPAGLAYRARPGRRASGRAWTTRRGTARWRCALLLGANLILLLSVAQDPAAQEHGGTFPGAPPTERPAYLQRGDEVDTRYRSYRERLERFFQDFGARLEADAPDLLAKLREAPPAPVPFGYGLVPKLVPHAPRKSREEIVSASYGWLRTNGFIDRDLGRLEKLEARLSRMAPMTSEDRRREWGNMVDEYRILSANQKVIAIHIQHNRLWQGEIARNRHGYDRTTTLHDAVVEQQALLDALQAGDRVLEPYLHAREEVLSRQIREAARKVFLPDFIHIEHPSSQRWIVRVPLYTDIEDRPFVEAFQFAVENAWRFRDEDDEFRVAIDIRPVPARQLYPDGDLPQRGEHIDLAQHLRRFPAGGAVLTTGGNTTYVLGRGSILGPHDVAPNVLAHEFGHILGFVDGYFRGYRDRGPDGYEVLEVIADPDDIMSAPGTGRVARHHFEQLLDARRGRSP